MLQPSAPARSRLHALDDEVRSYLDSAAEAEARDVFARAPLGGQDTGTMSITATWLATMATAWFTPGSAFVQDEHVRRTIVDGVERILDAGYHEGAEARDNWWDWEIGTPRPLADVLCLFRDELPESSFTDAAAAIRYFIPDPTYSRLMNYPSTASNRVSTTRAALIAAVAEEDEQRLEECVAALPEAWRTVDRLDGFYEDGGFIQHIDVPYTGNYGTDLLKNLTPLLTMLDGTAHDVPDKDALWDRIDSAVLPIMVNGHVLDAVRGRAVARLSSNGSVVGRAAAGVIAQLARLAPRERSERWMGLLQRWSSANPTLDLLEGTDVPSAVALQEALWRPAGDAEEPATRYFSSMDRLVHRAGGWTAAVAMCSNRISAYEGTEDENSWGVLTGNSMRYLFLGDDPAPFDDHFWATLDYSRPPGTTNHRTEFVPTPTRGSSINLPRNEWTGGLVHGALSAAAMHQVNRDGEAPACRRLTVAGPEWIVELVSDIRTDLTAFTTVENRLFPEGSAPTFIVQGEEVHDPVSLTGVTWAYLDDAGGYLFPGGGRIDAGVTRRVGSTQRVERSVDEIPRAVRVSRRWATLDLRHDSTPAWWALLPGADLAATRAASSAMASGSFPVQMLQNDAAAQVVSVDGTTLIAAVWAPTTLRLDSGTQIGCAHPLLLLARRTSRGLTLRLTDPTHAQKRTEVTVSGAWKADGIEGIAADDLAVRVEGAGSRVTAATRGRGGRSFVVRLAAA